MTGVLHESLNNIGGDEIWQDMVVHPSLLYAYYHNKTGLWSTLVKRMNFIIMFTLHRQDIILSFFQFNSSAHPHSQATSVLCLNFEVSPHINVKLLGDFHPIHAFNSSIHILSWAKSLLFTVVAEAPRFLWIVNETLYGFAIQTNFSIGRGSF